MANANNNIMSININPSASTGSNVGNSKSGYKTSSQKGGNDFNSALDRANNTINRQAAPAQQNPSDAEEVSYSDAATKNPDTPVENQNTTSQGQNNQPQDAPQSLPQNTTAEKNIPAEIDSKNVLNDSKIEITVETEKVLPNIETQPELEISDTPEIQNVLPFMFNANTETLLPPQVTENTGEVNLMAVVPQSGENKGQEMLNILSGKTWTAEDVQATLSSQNPQNVQVEQSAQSAQTTQVTPNLQTATNTEVNPDALNFAQNGKNFTFTPDKNSNNENLQPQIFARQNTLIPEQSQVQIQPQMQAQNQQTANPNLILEQAAQIQTTAENEQQILQPTAQRQLEIQEQPILNSVQPQIQPKQVNPQNQTQITDLFVGNLQVEEQNAPLSPIQPTLRQQPEQNQQQPNNQNLNTTSQNSNDEVQIQTQSQTQVQNVGGEEILPQNLTPANNNVQTQPVVQTQTPEAAAQAPREVDIPAQIVEQARLIRTAENTEMVINLKPEHLGQLTLRVSVSQNGAVNASFYSDNAQVRAAIENSIVQLKQELSDQGLKVDNVQVSSYLSDSGLMNGQGGQAWQQQQQSNGRQIDFNALQDEVDAVTPDAESETSDGVDYKI